MNVGVSLEDEGLRQFILINADECMYLRPVFFNCQRFSLSDATSPYSPPLASHSATRIKLDCGARRTFRMSQRQHNETPPTQGYAAGSATT